MKQPQQCSCSSCISNPNHCFYCKSANVYFMTIDGKWKDRWQYIDCGSYVDGHGGVVKGGYIQGYLKVLGMIRA